MTMLRMWYRCFYSFHAWIILFLAMICVHRSCQTTSSSKTLKTLLDGYDFKVRPYDEGPPVHIDLGVEVQSLSSISATSMDFTLTMYFREHWHDPRLASNATTHIVLQSFNVDDIWSPDIYFENEKTAKIHHVTYVNKLMHIEPNGTVRMSMRLSATLACPMSLEYFPMDSQTCNVTMMSYAYDIENMVLSLDRGNVSIDKDIEIPRFTYRGMEVTQRNIDKHLGTFSICEIELKFVRQMQAYLLTVYIPSGLLVAIAWLSFWIDARAAPARVSLGITTVLTVTTMTSGVMDTLPVVTYAKAIDIWLAACLLFVFFCLLEYAMANYLVVLETRRLYKQKSQNSQNMQMQIKDDVSVDIYPNMVEMEILVGEKHFTALQLDKISRISFPIIFAVFNLVYWSFYIHKGDLPLQDDVE